MTTMSEAHLQTAIIDTCKLMGLYVHHCHAVRLPNNRVLTPIQGLRGFPDLVIVGPGGLLFRELKAAKGVLSAEQRMWLGRLNSAGCDAAVWTPVDWPADVMAQLQAVA